MIKRPGSTILSASILILLCGMTAPIRPEERDTLAVFDLRAAGVSAQAAATASSALLKEMRRMEKFTLIDHAPAVALLKEKGITQKCADRPCALRAGKALSTKKIAVGEMGALGNAFVITVSVIDTERNLAEYTARATAASLADIDAAAARIVDALRAQVEGKDLPRPTVAESDIPAPMYICGNAPRRGDVIALEKNQGMAALAGARARVKGLFTQHNVTYIDLIWIDAKAKTQGSGGYLADKFRLVSRQDQAGDAAR